MAFSGLAPAAHHRFLLQHLDRAASGDIKRLMVLMPPGSAKSTYSSVIFPIWWFMRHPRSSIIAVSHTAALAEQFSRSIHTLIEQHHHIIGFSLKSNDRSAGHWRTDAGGEYLAAGVRGAITGRRADLAIIDDPIKSMAEADSARHRQQVWDWYTSELTTRLKPGARIVLVMTRWHEQDLAGQLAARAPDAWRILRLPALAEANDPMERPIGAPLWPEWENQEALLQKRDLVGSRVWAALFQQSPLPPEGHLFKVSSLDVITAPLATTRTVRAWDLAATAQTGQQDPDWTVGLRLGVTDTGQYVIEDIVRLRGNVHTVEDAITATARSDGHAVVISLPIDPGQAGKAQIARLSSLLQGYRISSTREQGSKAARAAPVAAQIEAGNVAVLKALWLAEFIDELGAFPHGHKDDQVDALSRAFLTLLDLPGASRRVFIPYNVR